ncbi:MAG: hypothetical protein HOM25_08955 [Rhodospirillaceae bacterium]|nr:hypothetical protein [Rhodospirillaceae bacterium]MBT5665693.1 hypothetical protein [Rhodospirillaceae bacterium]
MSDIMAEYNDKRRYVSEVHRRQRSKNYAMLAILGGLVILFYVVAIVRIGGAG